MKKFKIELTEKQLRVIESALETYMRTMMGQAFDLSEALAFYNYDYERYRVDEKKRDKEFGRRLIKRDAIYEVLDAVFKVAYGTTGIPSEKSDDVMTVECIWDAMRFARGVSRWSQPFQIGSEPSPKIEVTEDA